MGKWFHSTSDNIVVVSLDDDGNNLQGGGVCYGQAADVIHNDSSSITIFCTFSSKVLHFGGSLLFPQCHKGSPINDVTVIGGEGQDIVTAVQRV